ncbi:hypothetical protein [Mycolicibacterium austroafricanum]|uniref:hypothetical protein n=1 Tax=Mycolicibacterium austroafricanum TaxID=39687 RepID=UPI001F164E84|nr:hypothetical protein [Mycolicibacterium austroafricanum]
MATAATVAAAGWTGAPTAGADPHQGLTEVITAARGSAPCGPLRYDPQAEHAAEIINRSTYAYVNHTAEHVPADDTHPAAIAADVGLTGTKVISLQGAGKSERDAIQGLVTQGYLALPDCAYTDFGTSMLYEPESGYSLAVVVMAGP